MMGTDQIATEHRAYERAGKEYAGSFGEFCSESSIIDHPKALLDLHLYLLLCTNLQVLYERPDRTYPPRGQPVEF